MENQEHPLVSMTHEQRQKTIDFILSGKLPGELLARRENELMADVMAVVRADAPIDLTISNPDLYRELRAKITELRIAGYV